VDDLVREALARAPAVAAASAGVEASREREEPAGALPDPTLELAVQDAGFPDWTVGEAEMSMIGPQLTQDFPFPGKQGARKAAAIAETGVRREALEGLRRGVARDVRTLYAGIYAADRELELIDAGREIADALSATVTHHVEMGEMHQAAALQAQLLVSRIEERRTDVEAERIAAVASLNRHLDRPGDAPLGIVTWLPATEPPPAALDSLAELGAAEVAVGAAAGDAAEARLSATRREVWPDFLAGAGVGFRGDLDPVVQLRLGVRLPLWQAKNQRPRIRAAEADVAQARHELRDARAMARAEATRWRAAWHRADEQVRRYDQSFVPRTRRTFDAARSAYLGRRGDFGAVVDAFDEWLDARKGLARREADRYAAWAALDALLNPAPDEPPAARGESE